MLSCCVFILSVAAYISNIACDNRQNEISSWSDNTKEFLSHWENSFLRRISSSFVIYFKSVPQDTKIKDIIIVSLKTKRITGKGLAKATLVTDAAITI